MIQAQGLVKRYGDRLALDKVSFGIGAGEIVGLLGLNGAGKSTTMNILTGFISMDAGSVTINGHDLVKTPLLAKAQVGYLPEQPAFYAGMRVKEYLGFIARLRGVDKKITNVNQHIQRVCDQVGLSQVAGRLIRNLSKGYRQRVSFAQALVGDPAVLILDEPTVGLDPSQVQEIRTLVKNLGQERTVLISSHILSEIRALCTRVLVLKDGRLLADDSPEHLATGSRQKHAIRLRLGTEDAEQARNALLLAPGEPRVQLLGSQEAGTLEVSFVTTPDRDARRDAFFALSQAGVPLLHSYGAEPSLEDIFLHLVAPDRVESP